MSTPVSNFYEPVRAFLDDFNTTVQKYSDTTIASVVRAIVNCGEMPGYTMQDHANIAPGVNDMRVFGQIVYRTCIRLVAPRTSAYSYRTRAISESFGSSREFLMSLESALLDSENAGVSFNSSLDFASWAKSVTGVDIWAGLTDMNVNAPVATVSIGAGGIQVSG